MTDHQDYKHASLMILNEGDTEKTIVSRSLNGLFLTLHCIEQLGWSSVMHLITTQEVLRLDTVLRLAFPRNQDFIQSVRRRLKQVLLRLQLTSIYSWPLLLLRINSLCRELHSHLQLDKPGADISFMQLCNHYFNPDQIRAEHLGGEFESHTSFYSLLQKQGNMKSLQLAELIDRAWQSGIHQKSVNVVYRNFYEQLSCFLMPRPGLLSIYGWQMSEESLKDSENNFVIIQVVSDRITIKSLYQLLQYLRYRQGLAIMAVELSDCNYQVIVHSENKDKVLTFLSTYLHHAEVFVVSKSKPVFQERSIRLEPMRKMLTEKESSDVRHTILVNETLQPQSYCIEASFQCCMDWLKSPDFQLTTKSAVQSICCILDLALNDQEQILFLKEKIQNMSHGFSLKRNFKDIVICFKVETASKALTAQDNADFFLIKQLTGCSFGLYSQTPQDRCRLHALKGDLFTHLVIDEPWFTDITHSETTIKGNCEAGLRHLSLQGWILCARGVQTYHMSAALIRQGFSLLELTAELSEDVQELSCIDYKF